MQKIQVRKARQEDMEDIYHLQSSIFQGEQQIPQALIPIAESKKPQWWCAMLEGQLVGAAACWQEGKEVHWGRFAISLGHRGLSIGSKLARSSLEDIFSQGVEEIYMEARDRAVHIICGLGGQVVGDTVSFYDGTVTPLCLKKQAYIKK